MKKNCYGCKALNDSRSPCCELGYQLQVVWDIKKPSHIGNIKPLEDCPKPTSTKQLFNELSMKHKY